MDVHRALRKGCLNKRRSWTHPMAFLAFHGRKILLRPIALSDVDHSTGVLNEIATLAENRMTNAVNVPDGATCMHNAIIHFYVGIFMLGPVGRFSVGWWIVGVNSLAEFFGSG